jgi:hypothetical protein
MALRRDSGPLRGIAEVSNRRTRPVARNAALGMPPLPKLLLSPRLPLSSVGAPLALRAATPHGCERRALH